MSVSRSQWLGLYRNLLREAASFSHYNFRSFALRRVREHFRREQPADVEAAQLYEKGLKELASLKRQVSVHGLSPQRPIVIESKGV